MKNLNICTLQIQSHSMNVLLQMFWYVAVELWIDSLTQGDKYLMHSTTFLGGGGWCLLQVFQKGFHRFPEMFFHFHRTHTIWNIMYNPGPHPPKLAATCATSLWQTSHVHQHFTLTLCSCPWQNHTIHHTPDHKNMNFTTCHSTHYLMKVTASYQCACNHLEPFVGSLQD